MIRQLISFLFLTLIISGCYNSTFEINGTLEGAGEGTMIYIDKLGSVNLEPYDSVAVDQNGKFTFDGDISMTTLFLLRTDNDSFLTTLIEPTFLIVMGGMVAFIMASVLLIVLCVQKVLPRNNVSRPSP